MMSYLSLLGKENGVCYALVLLRANPCARDGPKCITGPENYGFLEIVVRHPHIVPPESQNIRSR